MSLLEIEDLSVGFRGQSGTTRVLDGVSFAVGAGEVVGLVGESGSGKSVTALAVMRLLGEQGLVLGGGIRFAGAELLAQPERRMRAVRGSRIAMVFQDPMTSLNPLLRVGFQIEEVLRAHLGLGHAEATRRVVGLLEEVGLPNAALRARDHPHLLSGGMRQRVMIAMAMACEPRLLIADEPTTALDVTIQAQILDLMDRLRREHGSSILLITHDMGVVARMADGVVVMYAGEVAEVAPAPALFAAPAHPYTRLLLAAMPSARHRAARLKVIPGGLPPAGVAMRGCRFQPRCPDAAAICAEQAPPLKPLGAGRAARCWFAA